MPRLSAVAVGLASLVSVGAQHQNVPDVQLWDDQSTQSPKCYSTAMALGGSGQYAVPQECCSGTSSWDSDPQQAKGFCTNTKFLDSHDKGTSAETRCTGIDKVNFTLYSRSSATGRQTCTPASPTLPSCADTGGEPPACSNFFSAWQLSGNACTMVAAPCCDAGGAMPCSNPCGAGVTVAGSFSVGYDPQFPTGAYMQVKKSSSRTCQAQQSGVGLYFNQRCTGLAQYTLPNSPGTCIQTGMGSSSQQAVYVKLGCPAKGFTTLSLYQATQGVAGGPCGGTPFFEANALNANTLNATSCEEVATGDQHRAGYNPLFPQGAWFKPFPGMCQYPDSPTDTKPPPVKSGGCGGGCVILIIIAIVVAIVAIGAIGLVCIKKSAEKGGALPTNAASIYADSTLNAGF